MEFQKLQERYASVVNRKAASFNKDAEKYTDKTLDKMIRQEKKMQRKVPKLDSVKAKLLFAYSIDSLQKIKGIIQNIAQEINPFASGDIVYKYIFLTFN